ncbi:MAG: hypothetical protein JWN92_1429 [Candidatus Acidoferrum typicum]|jgi:hypothetical protein|nr:hypothetical protein [Candidatus Acidoferrum typicum]
MDMLGLMMQLGVFPPQGTWCRCRLTTTAANPAIAVQGAIDA